MNVTTLGIDIAKNVFQLHGVDINGNTVLKKRLSRVRLLPFLANLSSCLIGIEACGGSNYWYRKLTNIGHNVKIMSPQFVKPYVKSNKNDASDAEAICEAVSRPSMRFIPPKNLKQQDIQSIHRIRERLIKERTALSNEIRGLLGEYGIIITQGIHNVRNKLTSIIEDENNELTLISKQIFSDLYDQLVERDNKIAFYTKHINQIFNQEKSCQLLEKLPGVGPIAATAIIASVGDPKLFKNGRELSAWLGVVPRQHSSGEKNRLLGITKRGNSYIRKLLIHGARSVVYRAKKKTDNLSKWINKIYVEKGCNKASVALANKNIRHIWAMLIKGNDYKFCSD